MKRQGILLSYGWANQDSINAQPLFVLHVSMLLVNRRAKTRRDSDRGKTSESEDWHVKHERMNPESEWENARDQVMKQETRSEVKRSEVIPESTVRSYERNHERYLWDNKGEPASIFYFILLPANLENEIKEDRSMWTKEWDSRKESIWTIGGTNPKQRSKKNGFVVPPSMLSSWILDMHLRGQPTAIKRLTKRYWNRNPFSLWTRLIFEDSMKDWTC